MIGATNSRKSHFMHSIMKMERKVILDSEYNPNKPPRKPGLSD